MIPNLNLERQAETLAKAQQHWQKPPSTTAWTIAITREAGAQGSAVAQAVAQRLGWTFYDRELIEKIASEMGLRANLLESVDEKRKSFLLELAESMTAAGPVSEGRFVRHLVEILGSVKAHGHCVIVGRGAAQILPADGTLRVRLVAAREDRVHNIQRRLNLSAAEAAQWVQKKDQERTAFVRNHFNKDPHEPTNYDLTLNTSRWTVDQCVDFIVDAIKKLESGT